MNSHKVFIHIHQGCFAGTGAIVRLPQCQWSKPDGYGKISQCITTTKHSKAKAVCIFRGIYCTWHCLQDANCNTINYNVNISLCRLNQQKYMYFQWDVEYIAVIMTMADPCLRWVSNFSDVDMNSAILSPFNDSSGFSSFVARGIYDGNMIPGKYDDFSKRSYYLISGVEVMFFNAEFLIVRDGCIVEWLTYDSATFDPPQRGQ